MPPSPTRAWISYRPSMTFPTKGSWVMGPARSFRRGGKLDVGIGVDLGHGQLRPAVGAILVDALDGDVAAGDGLAGEIRSADDRGPPALRDPLVRAGADRDPDFAALGFTLGDAPVDRLRRSEEHTSELQSQSNLVCRLLLEKK